VAVALSDVHRISGFPECTPKRGRLTVCKGSRLERREKFVYIEEVRSVFLIKVVVGLSLKQVRYFVAAAETGQVSRAAIEMNVSQSAVTTAIRQLEETLSVKLLSRSSTGVTLTTDGEQFLRHARDILGTVDQALHFQRRTTQHITGHVRVGVTYTVAGYFLAPLLARFHRVYPEIDVLLEEGTKKNIEGAILNGTYDLGLMVTQHQHFGQEDRRLTYSTLYRSSRRLWLSTSHPFLQAETVGFKDIATAPYIALTVDGAWDFAQRYWEGLPYRPNIVFKTSSVEAIRTMVASGMGVTILSDMIYRPWSLEGDRIETRDIAEGVPTVDVSIAFASRRALSGPARTISTFLQRSCNSALIS
jgi:DNA-binding transcriptional LysR family regulator